MKKAITTAILLASSVAFGMEPVDRFDLNQSRPKTFDEPCSDDWKRLHFWYSDVDMPCSRFRELILGCADAWAFRLPFKSYRLYCMASVALGSSASQRMGYGNFSPVKHTHFDEPFSEKDIDRVLRLLRVLHGIPSTKKNPHKMLKALQAWRNYLIKHDGNPRTKANRDAAKRGARRTRHDP